VSPFPFVLRYGFRHFNSIHCCRHYTARIAAALAARIETFYATLHGFIPQYPQGGGSACLHAAQHGIRMGKSMDFPFKSSDAFFDGVGYEDRQAGVEISEAPGSFGAGGYAA